MVIALLSAVAMCSAVTTVTCPSIVGYMADPENSEK